MLILHYFRQNGLCGLLLSQTLLNMIQIVILWTHQHYIWYMVHLIFFWRSILIFNFLCKNLEFSHHLSQLKFIWFFWCYTDHVFVKIWNKFLHLSRCISLRINRDKYQFEFDICTFRNVSNCPENCRHIVKNVWTMIRTASQAKVNQVVCTREHITWKWSALW